MQRLYNLDKWRAIPEGGVHFTNTRPRKVALEVNAPAKAGVSLVDHTGEVHFLALVEGRDTIEFHSLGEFSILCDVPDTMLYTPDGDDVSAKIVAPVSFTKIMERRRRNPELEAFQYQIQRTMELTLDRQARDFEQRLQARLAEASRVAEAKVRPEPARDVAQSAAPGSAAGPLPAAGDAGGGGHDGAGGGDKPSADPG